MTQTSRCVFSHCSSLFLQRFFWRLPCPKHRGEQKQCLRKQKLYQKREHQLAGPLVFQVIFFLRTSCHWDLPSLKLTAACPWKSMVGRCIFFWDGLGIQGRTVSFRERILPEHVLQKQFFQPWKSSRSQAKNLLPWSLGGWMSNLGHL